MLRHILMGMFMIHIIVIPWDNQGVIGVTKDRIDAIEKVSNSVNAPQSATSNCLQQTEQIYLPGDTFFSTLDIKLNNDLPLIGTTVFFKERRLNQSSSESVVDVFARMEFNASSIQEKWQQEVSQMLLNNKLIDTGGCSEMSAHSFSMKPNGRGLQGYFHHKYVKRACIGNEKIDQAYIETDVWNDLNLNIVCNQSKLALDVSGNMKSNMPDQIRDIAKFTGNVLSVFPLTNSTFLGWDKQIFAALKAESDAMQKLAEKRNIKTLGTPQTANNLDLVYDVASFEYIESNNVIGLVIQCRTSIEHPLNPAFAGSIRELFDGKGIEPSFKYTGGAVGSGEFRRQGDIWLEFTKDTPQGRRWKRVSSDTCRIRLEDGKAVIEIDPEARRIFYTDPGWPGYPNLTPMYTISQVLNGARPLLEGQGSLSSFKYTGGAVGSGEFRRQGDIWLEFTKDTPQGRRWKRVSSDTCRIRLEDGKAVIEIDPEARRIFYTDPGWPGYPNLTPMYIISQLNK